MIDTVLNITVGYLFVGTFALPTVVLLEIMLVQSRGAGFRDWLRKVLGESGEGIPLMKALGAFLRWPLFVLMFIVARLRGKTLLESVAEAVERKNAMQKKALKAAEGLVNGQIPLDRGWMTIPPGMLESIEVNLHYHRMIYIVPGEDEDYETVITHLVIEGEEAILCWRVFDEDCNNNLPLSTAGSLKEAKHLCEQDDVWLAVSPPCRADAREKLWREESERLVSEIDMDKIADEVTLDDAYDPEGVTLMVEDPDERDR